MDMTVVEGFPVCQVGDLAPQPDGLRWLVEPLWLRSAAGICGGMAKSYKSWWCLELAVAVASGTDCLGKYTVADPGPVLGYFAEDPLGELQSRIEGLCKHREVDIRALPFKVITVPVLRLDDEKDRARLLRTVEGVRPRLLILDPLVRLHRLNENDARDISGLLGFLREVQRTFDTAIVLTHHSSKKKHGRPGESLRGSTDLHAFADSLAYLSRRGDDVTVVVEHRSAPPPKPFSMQLVTKSGLAHLELKQRANPRQCDGAGESVIQWMQANPGPQSRQVLRAGLRMNNQRLGDVLQSLRQSGQIQQDRTGWCLAQENQLLSEDKIQ